MMSFSSKLVFLASHLTTCSVLNAKIMVDRTIITYCNDTLIHARIRTCSNKHRRCPAPAPGKGLV
uniref:Secreted protein n=1 Tax=Timema poppense TaxID=170557 RepID=A0A7R9HGA6_TIMPO|nr:unnamed protein product [Timema poppensis]